MIGDMRFLGQRFRAGLFVLLTLGVVSLKAEESRPYGGETLQKEKEPGLRIRPKSRFVLPYSLPAPVYVTGKPGLRLPMVHTDKEHYYFRASVSGASLILGWPKVDGSARQEGWEMVFSSGSRFSFSKAYILFDPVDTYEAISRDESSFGVEMRINGQPVRVKVRSEWFNIVLSVPPSEKAPGASTANSLDPEAIQQLKAKVSFKKPPALKQKDHIEAICILEGPNGSGTGFLFWMDNNYYVITNQHVAFSLNEVKVRTVSGKLFSPLLIEVAEDRDIARILIAEEPEQAFHESRMPVLGEKLTVLGNSQGAGRITYLTGRASGLGPNEVEVTAEFVSGNSGSPIISDKDQAILGVAAYLQTIDSQSLQARNTEFMKSRRVGLLLDDTLSWIPADWRRSHQSYVDYRQLEDFAFESMEISALVLSEHLLPILYKSRDTMLSRWVERRNEMVQEWRKLRSDYTFARASQAKADEMREKQKQYYERTREHHTYLTSQITQRQRRVQGMKLHPDTTYGRLEVQRLNDLFERALSFNTFMRESFEKLTISEE